MLTVYPPSSNTSSSSCILCTSNYFTMGWCIFFWPTRYTVHLLQLNVRMEKTPEQKMLTSSEEISIFKQIVERQVGMRHVFSPYDESKLTSTCLLNKSYWFRFFPVLSILHHMKWRWDDVQKTMSVIHSESSSSYCFILVFVGMLDLFIVLRNDIRENINIKEWVEWRVKWVLPYYNGNE